MDYDVYDNPLQAAFVGAPYVAAYVDGQDSFEYHTDRRPRRDVCATITYVLLAALTLAGSIPIFLRTDNDLGLYSNRFFSSSTSCNIQKYQQVAWMYNDAAFDPTFMRRFKAEVAMWVPATAGAILVGSSCYLFAFIRFPRTVSVLLVLGSVLAGSSLSVLCFISGRETAGIVMAASTAVATGFLLWASHWKSTFGDLMGLAGTSLRRTVRLLPATLGILLVGLMLLAYGMAAFFSAVTYGHVSRNWDAVKRYNKAEEDGFCVNGAKQRIPCCTFVTSTWAWVYAGVAAAFVLWSAGLALQIRTFTAADTLAQWYFSAAMPAYSTFNTLRYRPGAASAAAPGTVRRALRHCLSSAFGSLALTAVVLAPLRAVRFVSLGLLRVKGVGRVLRCVVRPVAARTEAFSVFAVAAAAITGQPLVAAARAVFTLLQRNFLPAYALWRLPGVVMFVVAVLLSLVWAVVVFYVTYGANVTYPPIVFDVAMATSGVAFFGMLYGLLFTTGLQLDAVQTLYVCYAADKEQRRVLQPDVHAVIRLVPGQALQLHRTGLVYAVPDAPPSGRPSAPDGPLDAAAPLQQPPLGLTAAGPPSPPTDATTVTTTATTTSTGVSADRTPPHQTLDFGAGGGGGTPEMSPRSVYGAVSNASALKRRAT